MKQKKMKIATMVASEIPFPIPKDFPRPYAPLQIALDVAEGLVKKGHQITFFGPKGSKSKKFDVVEVPVTPLYKNKIFEDPMAHDKREREKIYNLYDQYIISLLFKENQTKKFDIIYIHPADRTMPFALLTDTPVVYTLHDPIYPWRTQIFNLYKSKNQYYVSISNNQRKPAPNINWIDTVYNGIDLKLFPFNPKPKNQILHLGRLLERKGPQIAVQAAIKAEEKLLIAGDPNEGKLWDKKIKPYLGKNIQYAGNIPYKETYKYYGESKALLCPIKWEEPFGLTFIEAMACGTPAISFDRGSAKEVIKDGKTGFVVKNIRGMVNAIKKIDQIDRRECRKWVEDNFTIEKMVDNYEKVFQKILKK